MYDIVVTNYANALRLVDRKAEAKELEGLAKAAREARRAESLSRHTVDIKDLVESDMR